MALEDTGSPSGLGNIPQETQFWLFLAHEENYNSKFVCYSLQVESDLVAPCWSLAAPEDVPSGIRVRLVNLPKKRNIHRDLQLAFKGFPGIIDVIPAVSGSKKTRDPICKGFAFVDLKSEADANRLMFEVL